jgi:hypothetical protein
MLPEHNFHPGLNSVVFGATLALAASAFAQTPAMPPAAAPAATGATATPPTTPAAPRPFKDVIKDAREIPGFFTLYEKDDKVWMEIRPEQFDQPFLFSAHLSHGIGEQLLYGGLMAYPGLNGKTAIGSFRKAGTQVQLLQKNVTYFAKAGSREARAVEQGFSDSLLASAAIVSQPHAERKSVLVEVNALLLTDIPAGNTFLERAFRQPYAFDARNSSILKARGVDEETNVNIRAHYALARVVLPPPVPGPAPVTPPPRTLQDVRSLFLGWQYNFARLPGEPMRPRRADARVGYYTSSQWDFTGDSKRIPLVQYVNRWRLEKKDPDAALSEAKKPIVFWLDRSIPDKYRPAVTAGILEWNKAFERIGFKDTVQVKIQPDDADWESLDSRRASVTWMTTARPSFGAIGPSQWDPRTGEILDADIGVDVVRLRNRRNQRVEEIGSNVTQAPADGSHALCMIAEHVAQESGFAIDLLAARGDIDPDGAEAEAFVLEDLKDTMMHEVGHTLGLYHNFRASSVFTAEQLADPEFTRKNGIAGSVMEYNAVNIAEPGKPQGAYGMHTLGPYDYWAIEYAYKPIPADKEEEELKKILARSAEPLLAYSNDFDNADGIDPEASQGDLGSDPLKFNAQRMKMARELWERWQDKPLKDGESYAVLRRSVARGLAQVGAASARVAKYVGGITVLRDHAGSPRAPLLPVAADKQRAALKLVEKGLFSAESFKFKPEFMRRLTVDYLDRSDSTGIGLVPGTTDYSLAGEVLTIQRNVLTQLLSDAVATRILDSADKLDKPATGFKLSELYATLSGAIWSELKTGSDIGALRRNLQREHVRRMVNVLLRPAATTPADARSLQRMQAIALRQQIATAMAKPISVEAKAHLAESLDSLSEALKAPMQRAGA